MQTKITPVVQNPWKLTEMEIKGASEVKLFHMKFHENTHCWSIHEVKKPLSTTMLATSKNVLFPDHNHLLTTGTDVPTL